MKKAISILLLLCLLAGICSPAAAEGGPKVLAFPKSGITFTVPDFVENMPGCLFSIADAGETSYKSGIIFAYVLYLPRSSEDIAALNELTAPFAANPSGMTEEVMQAFTEFMAPRIELFLVVGLGEGNTWEKDFLTINDTDKMKDPVKIGDCDGFTYYLTTFKPDYVQERLGQVGTEYREAFIDVTDQLMKHPELFTLKERNKSVLPPEPGTQINFEAADYDGGTVTRADLTAGSKVTIITYWQTFCGPCKEEMPDLDRLAREYGDKGLNVVCCVCNATSESILGQAREITDGYHFRNIKLTGSLLEVLPFSGTPTTYFLDAEGRVLDYPIAGRIPADYTAALEDYLNGKTDEFQALIKQKVDGGETPQQTEGEQTYTVRVVDQNGDPVPEVAIAFCSATGCTNVYTDEEGKCVYKGPAYKYHVTVVEAPDGYSEDFDDDVYTEKYSCSVTIVIDKE
jgi:thiol-disulfide isomerase/thioredoxin